MPDTPDNISPISLTENPPPAKTCYRVSLIKGSERWQFKWEPGNEAALINAVAGIARDPNVPFDWYDAAVVCKHIVQPFHAENAKT